MLHHLSVWLVLVLLLLLGLANLRRLFPVLEPKRPTALAEGLSVSGAVHTFGHRERTITTWFLRAGTHAERRHGRLFRNLQLLEIQLDELRTTLRDKGHDGAFRAMGAGGRGKETTVAGRGRIVVWSGEEELSPPPVGQGRATDALGYMESVPGKTAGPGVSRTLNTAFVERLNLTIRRGIAALQRRSWSTTQTQRHLELHFEWWRAYFHFVRPHGALRERWAEPQARRGKQQPQAYRRRTPAMAVGVMDHRWTVEELLRFPLPA
jgi:hypothetical protein